MRFNEKPETDKIDRNRYSVGIENLSAVFAFCKDILNFPSKDCNGKVEFSIIKERAIAGATVLLCIRGKWYCCSNGRWNRNP